MSFIVLPSSLLNSDGIDPGWPNPRRSGPGAALRLAQLTPPLAEPRCSGRPQLADQD
ncbi:hypothetical protein [Saccharopolyspora sp. NPDC002376]